MYILITGGTGFIGSALSEYFSKIGYTVFVLSRYTSKKKLPKNVSLINDLTPDLEPFDVIINLAGEPLSKKRWNPAFKNAIYDSRINTTKIINDYIEKCSIKPKVLLSGAAIGLYGDSLTEVFNEACQPTHQTFTQKLCHDWEERAYECQKHGVRVCILRFGIVLEKHGGALLEMINSFKFGLGATLGHGKQWMSWIHLEDVIGIINFLIHHTDLSGIFNLTAPNPVTNKEFTKILSQQFKRPALFNMPASIATIVFGEMAEAILLSGQRVLPARLMNEGYTFQHSQLKGAISAIFK